MEIAMEKRLLLLLCVAAFDVALVNLVASTSYDYSAAIECLAEPGRAQYGGGIIRNPEFKHGLKGWSGLGNSKIAARRSDTGNWFSVAHSRSLPSDSMSQQIYLQKNTMYTLSAWVQLNGGNAAVIALFKTSGGFVHAGAVEAQSGCWSMLKGGLTAESTGAAKIYFESENTAVEIWVDSVSLQPFIGDEWRAHQEDSIDKIRKKTVRFQVVDGDDNAVPGAAVAVEQQRPGFPFGCAIASTILGNAAYQHWFTSRFTVTTFENEMKWYANENVHGKEDYAAADAMLAIAKRHGITVRGHNVLWDDPQFQPRWVHSLSAKHLRDATNARVNSVVSRYKGQLIAWDVVNEDLHFSFFESKLGGNASEEVYNKVHQLDPTAVAFLNDFNTLEQPGDRAVAPAKYLQKLTQIQAAIGGARMAIGLEGHFAKPDIAYMRSALDTLAAAKRPIWLTEIDVAEDRDQAADLEKILREAYAHPAVEGIVIWGAWHPEGCYRMCLTDGDFKNLPTGDVVDKLIAEWKSGEVAGQTDADGFLDARLFHGEYKVSVTHPSANSSTTKILLQVNSNSQDRVGQRIQV